MPSDVRFFTGDKADSVASWVACRIPGCERGFGLCAAMAVMDGETLLGAVVFHNYSPEAGVMEMSAAADSPRWLTRKTLYAMHDYIFQHCQLAVMRVSENNKRMLGIAERYGYTPFRIPRLRGRGEAEVILTLGDDEWKRGKFHG